MRPCAGLVVFGLTWVFVVQVGLLWRQTDDGCV
jgi:hypothetical protein